MPTLLPVVDVPPPDWVPAPLVLFAPVAGPGWPVLDRVAPVCPLASEAEDGVAWLDGVDDVEFVDGALELVDPAAAVADPDAEDDD